MKSKTLIKNMKNDHGNKIILIYTPTHGNLGDSAITIAEHEFLKKYFPDRNVYEFTKNETIIHKKEIRKYISKNDIVVINGGGILGSLWKFDHNVLCSFVRAFKNNKVVVMPQTVFFYDDDIKFKEKFKRKIAVCKDLTIFCRDKKSYDTMKNLNVGCKFEYVPDIVLFLKAKYDIERQNKALICFRKDHEKVDSHVEVFDILKKLGIDYDFTDMNIHKKVKKSTRKEITYQKLKEFASYKMVITDRLHGMIFATITETPCLAFDNVSKKVSGVYDWIKHLEYVKITTSKNLDENLIDSLFNFRDARFDQKKLHVAFKKIENEIKKTD